MFRRGREVGMDGGSEGEGSEGVREGGREEGDIVLIVEYIYLPLLYRLLLLL